MTLGMGFLLVLFVLAVGFVVLGWFVVVGRCRFLGFQSLLRFVVVVG